MAERFSVVVYANNHLRHIRLQHVYLPGDYTGQHHDGVKPCECVSVHDSAAEAREAAKRYRTRDMEESL